MHFDPYNTLAVEDTERYFEEEWEFMPEGGYSTSRLSKRHRQEALDVIIETIRIGGNINAFVPYLAMNYYDRYTSKRGLLKKKATVMEDIELLVITCLTLAFKTTRSVDVKTLDLTTFKKSRKLEEEMHQFLMKRPKNAKYFQGREVHEAEKVIEEGLKGQLKPITALCFIKYFLTACKPQNMASSEDKKSITQIILETQADIRFCAFKPSIISASAVTAFLSSQAPEYSQAYEKEIMHLRCIDKNCLTLVKETCLKIAKRKLGEDRGLGRDRMQKWNFQGEEKGLYVTIEYQLQWMTSVEIEALHDKYFDPFDPCGFEDVGEYLKNEQAFMTDAGYSENPMNRRLRQVGLHVISDTIRSAGKVDAFVPYLAMIYFDCYLSRRGLLKHKDTIMEDMELLAVSCLLLAFETSLSCDFWGEHQISGSIRELMMRRPRNVIYLFGSWDVSYAGGYLVNHIFDTPAKPITALCFINYFLKECKPQHMASSEDRKSITQIILETQADIRFCGFKPSIISASAVTAFLSCQAPGYSQTYQEKVMQLRCVDKNEFNKCLALICAEKKLGAVTEMKRLSLQDGGERGFHVTMDYETEWMNDAEIMNLSEMYFDPYDPRGFDDIKRYLDNESKYMAADGYSKDRNKERMRQIALFTIIETVRTGGKISAFVPYLAMNYYDRYISKEGILNKRATVKEEIELLALSCFALAFQTTLLYGYWKLRDESNEKILQYLLKRPRNVSFADSYAEDVIKRTIQLKEPITALCFINYFLSACKRRKDPKEEENITRIILETQDDIRVSSFKPSIICASAVTTFLSYQSSRGDYKIYEEKIMGLVGYIHKNELKNCLAVVKETCDKKKLRDDMKKLSNQGGENGVHVTIEYELEWKVGNEIEEILQTLGAGTRVSHQLARVDGEMRREADEIHGLLLEIQNHENVDGNSLERLKEMLTKLGKLSLRMEEVIISMTNYVETPGPVTQ